MKIKMFLMTILTFCSLSISTCNAMALLKGALGVVGGALVSAGIRTFTDQLVKQRDLKVVAAQAKEQDAKHYFVMNMMDQAYDVEISLACLRTNSRVTVNAGETQLIYDNASSDARCLVKSVTVYAKGGTTPLAPGTIPYNTAELSGTNGSIIMISENDTQGQFLVSAYTFDKDGNLTPVTPPSSDSTTGTSTTTPSTTAPSTTTSSKISTGTTGKTPSTTKTPTGTAAGTEEANETDETSEDNSIQASKNQPTDSDQEDTSSQPNSSVQLTTTNPKQIIPTSSKSSSQPGVSVKQMTIGNVGLSN